MVAFVNGKFINVSAHTSYLYFFKQPRHPALTAILSVAAGSLSLPWFAFHPHKAMDAAQTLSDRAAPVRFKFLNLHPVLGGPPIIHRQRKYRQRLTEIIFKKVFGGGFPGQRIGRRSAHYRGY
jgi:hypothetical protein